VETWREEGYDYAAHGAEALAWCGRPVVDVLVTDVRLPAASADGRSPNILENTTPVYP
jgi:hypothetical protein